MQYAFASLVHGDFGDTLATLIQMLDEYQQTCDVLDTSSSIAYTNGLLQI